MTNLIMKTLKTLFILLTIISIASIPVGITFNFSAGVIPLALLGMFLFGFAANICSDIVSERELREALARVKKF